MVSLGHLFTVAVVCLNFFIGYKVWRANSRQLSNQLFFSLSLELGLWVIFNYSAISATQDVWNLFFVRLVMVVTAALPVNFFLFALVFPDRKMPLKPFWLRVCLVWAIFITLFNCTPYVFVGATQTGLGLSLQFGWGIILAAINFLFFLPLSAWSFVKKIKKATGIEKIRLRYLSASFIGMILIGLWCNFIMVVFFENTNLVNLGSWLMSIIFTATIGYTLLKKRFASLDFLLAKIVYYFALAGWFIAFVFIVVRIPIFFGQPVFLLNLLFLALWLWVFLYLYQNLQNLLIKKIVNHGLDWQTENEKFLQKIAEEIDLETIMSETLRFVSLLIRGQNNLIFGDFFGENNFVEKSTFDHKLNSLGLYRLCLEIWNHYETPKPIIFEELNLRKNARFRTLLAAMKSQNLGVIFPIVVYHEVKGILIMSSKANHDPYFVQDIDFLTDTISQVSLLINKAILYQNTKNFSQHLQKKIDLATKKLTKINQKLIFADQLKDEFVSVASHELRTPMTAIKNYLWLVSKNNTPEKISQNQKFIDIAINSTDRLIRMVNDMLTISRIEGNRFELNKQILDLRSLSKQIHGDLLPIAEVKNLKFVVKNPSTPLNIFADRDKILEVMQNLVGNALKFTSVGEVVLTCYQERQQVFFAVSDTGPGIDKDDARKLFNKFCRLENSYVKIKETGTGLGLYIAKEIVKKHRGDLTFKSKLGEGSTFILSLPAHHSVS